MFKSLWKPMTVSFILLQGLINSAWSFLLTSPPLMTEEEVNERARVLSLEMNWETSDEGNGHRRSMGFENKKGKTLMKIQFENSFPQELGPYESQFALSSSQGKKVWTFVYRDNIAEAPTFSTEAPFSLEESMGIVHAPRILEKQTPQIATLPEITKLINDKQCIFYTGAGISAGVVPAMAQLMEKLQLVNLKERGRFVMILQRAIKDSSSYVRPMDEFYKACLYGKPTLAHNAIRDIVLKKEWGLITENLDLLHQRSGIKPLHHDGSNWLKSNISEEDLTKVDYVITVGLASDESGFLGWYKAANPKGTIIAINLQQPNYLGGEDFLLTGDVQQLLPLLREELF